MQNFQQVFLDTTIDGNVTAIDAMVANHNNFLLFVANSSLSLNKAYEAHQLGVAQKLIEIGTLSPDSDALAKVVARKSNDIIFPSGAYTANLMGFSTQVPAQTIYLANGKSRNKLLDDRSITLKHAKVLVLDGVSFETMLFKLLLISVKNKWMIILLIYALTNYLLLIKRL